MATSPASRVGEVLGSARASLLDVFDRAVLRTCSYGPRPRRGAVLCLHGLGDLLLAGHALESVVAHLRGGGLEPVLFVQPPLVAFARRAFGVAVEGVDRHRFSRRLWYRGEVLRSFAGRFEAVVQPTHNRMFRVEDCLVRATGAARRVGSAGHATFIGRRERALGDPIYTHLVEPRPGPLHELERYAEFAAAMGLSASKAPWSPPGRGAWGAGAARLAPAGPFLAVAPAASHPLRSWPAEAFAAVAGRVAARHGLPVVWLGERADPPTPPGLDLRGLTRIEDLPGLVSRAALVLCNDSGLFHLGVSLGRPTLAVGGGGMPARYFPYPGERAPWAKVVHRPLSCAGCDWRCRRLRQRTRPAPCLAEVRWEEVADAADELLLRGAQSAGPASPSSTATHAGAQRARL